MSKLAEPFLKNPISILRRKVIYHLASLDSGHENALKAVKLWESNIGSVESKNAGVPLYLQILVKEKVLKVSPISFATSMSKLMMDGASFEGKDDPIGYFRNPNSAQIEKASFPCKTATFFILLESLTKLIKREDPEGLKNAVDQVSKIKSLSTEVKSWVCELLNSGNGKKKSALEITNSDGSAIVNVIYTQMLDGLGPIKTDALMKRAIREVEATPEHIAYSVRNFL